MPLKVGRGRNTVTLTGPIAEGLEGEVRELLGPAADVIDDHVDKLYRRGRSKWPVRSARSIASFERGLRVLPEDERVEGYVAVTARDNRGRPYPRFIRSTREGRREDAVRIRSPLVTELRTPSKQIARDMAEPLREALARALEGVFDDG